MDAATIALKAFPLVVLTDVALDNQLVERSVDTNVRNDNIGFVGISKIAFQ